MDLQHQQLQQLSDWLKETEVRIRKMETEPMAGDMPGYVAQIEQHRVSQLSDGRLVICTFVLHCLY